MKFGPTYYLAQVPVSVVCLHQRVVGGKTERILASNPSRRTVEVKVTDGDRERWPFLSKAQRAWLVYAKGDRV